MGHEMSPTHGQYYAFSGTPAEVAAKLYQLPRDVVEGVFYALLVQGAKDAGIHVFNRTSPNDREGTVSAWEGLTLGALPDRILALLLSAEPDPGLRGKIDSTLRDHGDFAHLGTVPCPPTPRGAFGHPIRPHTGSPTLRAVVVTI
jgi:hypothetical protein